MEGLQARFLDGTSRDIDFTGFTYLCSGGTSTIYTGEIDSTPCVMKIITTACDYRDIFRRVRVIRERLLAQKNLPASFARRSVPIAQGLIESTMLGPSFSDLKETYPFLAFNFIEGESLARYLEGSPPGSGKRTRACKSLLGICVCLERAGIVHYDLYPDNFLVDANGRIYLIDLESAGVSSGGQWTWKPLVKGKTGIFCLPPDADPCLEACSPYFDRWNAVYLAFWVLFGYHPMEFLTRCDTEVLELLVASTSTSQPVWPPRLKNKADIEPYLVKDGVLDQMASDSGRVFQGATNASRFNELLVGTFIKGFHHPEKRPMISIVKTKVNLALKKKKTKRQRRTS